VPLNLTVLYPRWEIDTAAVVSYLPWLVWLVLLVVCWGGWAGGSGQERTRRAPGRQSDRPSVAMAFGWTRCGRSLFFLLGYFTLALLPVLGAFDMFYLNFSRVADHWQYLALIGPMAAVGGGMGWMMKRLGRAGTGRRVAGFVLAGGLVVGMGWLGRQRAVVYADAERLWREALRQNPGSWVPHSDLGVALVNQGRWDEALRLFREAIRISPNEGLPRNNLGMVLFQQGRVEEAMRAYREALRLKPYYYPAHFNLAVALARQERWEEAAAHYAEVLRWRPDHAQAHNNLGNVLGRLGQTSAALDHYGMALCSRPNFAEAHYNLGEVLACQGHLDEALRHYQAAVQSRPAYAHAHSRLGELALAAHRPAEAERHFLAALTEDPRLPAARYALGVAHRQQGRARQAADHWRQALQSRPDWIEPLNNLAWLLATHPDPALRDGPEAVRLASRAVALAGRPAPDFLDTLAAAQAEAGQFPAAMILAREARDQACADGLEPLADAIQRRLAAYQDGRPWREP
jgi:tetratricopeptide (TPR) repeat protein